MNNKKQLQEATISMIDSLCVKTLTLNGKFTSMNSYYNPTNSQNEYTNRNTRLFIQ